MVRLAPDHNPKGPTVPNRNLAHFSAAELAQELLNRLLNTNAGCFIDRIVAHQLRQLLTQVR